MNFFPLLILLLILAQPASAAESFLVLGSFATETAAHEEGRRVSEATGVEVLLYESPADDVVQYRLLTSRPGDDAGRVNLMQQLASAGISEPWPLTLDTMPYMQTVFPDYGTGELSDEELAEIDAMLQAVDEDLDPAMDFTLSALPAGDASAPGSMGNYVVAGSFQSAEKASALAAGLEGLSHNVSVKAGNVSGTLYHRVLLGPVATADESRVMVALKGRGIDGPWVLRGVSAPASPGLELVQPQRGFRIPGSPGDPGEPDRPTQPDNVAPTQSDYNPARLKKKTSSFPPPGADQQRDRQRKNAGRWRSEVGAEFRLFDAPGLNQLETFHPAVSFQAEYYKTWNDGADIFAFVPYGRWDAEDDERTHADIRELTWVHVGDDWEVRTGVRKVFWGVTEAQHLVDIINQTDNVENPDGEEKLGQPMINLSFTETWGVLDFYILPGFRERRFRGAADRPVRITGQRAPGAGL